MYSRQLQKLARLYKVQTAHRDGFRRTQQVSEDSLLATLRALGAAVDKPADIPAALAAKQESRWSSFAPPVAVCWRPSHASIEIRRPESEAGLDVQCRITVDGEERSWTMQAETRRSVELGRRRFVSQRLTITGPLPLGYHKLELKSGGRESDVMVISAPRRCYTTENERLWGAFLPLYALHTAESWGAGDLSDLGELFDWVRGLGGSMVGTLPLLSAFLDEPFEPSPYMPASRLHWNEFFVDPRQTPEWHRCPEARQAADRLTIGELRASRLVDYRRQAALKRRVLEQLALVADPHTGEPPGVVAYAKFRAAVEKSGADWRAWPNTTPAGDSLSERYHRYAQRVAEQQIAALAKRAGSPGLYLDLPLGVHPDGFDVWQRPDSFALAASGGAPPDRFFTKGQNWTFAPLHPERIRQDGYSYWIECLRHHFKHAGVLRIDHVMAMYRLYWIPSGAEASEGAYVQYGAEELYAVLCLESHRHRCRVVGEDLGTVPKYLRSRLTEHGIDRMYVGQFNFRDEGQAMLTPPAACVASVNTHDTPTFTAYWNGEDIDDQVELGLLPAEEASETRNKRGEVREAVADFLEAPVSSPDRVLRACMGRLGESPAKSVLVNLEDLWGETEPQNTPGTGAERPNWRRRARLSLEEMKESTEVSGALRQLANTRQANRRLKGSGE